MAIQFLMTPMHTIGGINWADAWHISLTIIGAGLIFTAVVNAIYTERLALQRTAVETK